MRIGQFVQAVPVCWAPRHAGVIGPQVQGIIIALSKDEQTMTIETPDGIVHLCHLAEATELDESTLPAGTRKFIHVRRATLCSTIGH